MSKNEVRSMHIETRVSFSRALTWVALVISLLLSTASRPLACPQTANIEDKVKAAIDGARRGNEELVSALKNSPDRIKAIPYLRPYVSDTDVNVTNALLTLAFGLHTTEAIAILVGVLKREDFGLSYRVASLLYQHYSCDEITRVDLGLRDRLLTLAERGSVLFAGKPTLLLSCFDNDQSVLQFLEKQRKAKGTIKLEMYMPNVPISVCADVALANLGQKDAVERVTRYIETGELDVLYFLLKAARFTNSKVVTAKLADLIKDKRELGPTCSHCETYFRVSDLALYVFGDEFGVDVGVRPQEFQRYKDEEISLADERIQTWVKTRNEKPK
jgi:hypothetical protein